MPHTLGRRCCVASIYWRPWRITMKLPHELTVADFELRTVDQRFADWFGGLESRDEERYDALAGKLKDLLNGAPIPWDELDDSEAEAHCFENLVIGVPAEKQLECWDELRLPFAEMPCV